MRSWFDRKSGSEQSVQTGPDVLWAYGATHAGRVRQNNEDFFVVNAAKGLFIVADGMGGHNAGEVASLHACKMVDAYFTTERMTAAREDKGRIRNFIIRGMLEAHGNIIDMACSNPAYSGMGCTMVLAVLVGNDLHIGHVGDARAYRFNPKRIALVTEDHSRVMEMVRAGHLSMEEARLSPMKNELTQAVGGHIGIVPEYCHLALNRQDRILLCSDGLWDMLPDDEIQQIVQNAACARKACEELIEAANRSGGEDNITAVVIFHQARGTPRPGDTVPRVGMHRT